MKYESPESMPHATSGRPPDSPLRGDEVVFTPPDVEIIPIVVTDVGTRSVGSAAPELRLSDTPELSYPNHEATVSDMEMPEELSLQADYVSPPVGHDQPTQSQEPEATERDQSVTPLSLMQAAARVTTGDGDVTPPTYAHSDTTAVDTVPNSATHEQVDHSETTVPSDTGERGVGTSTTRQEVTPVEPKSEAIVETAQTSLPIIKQLGGTASSLAAVVVDYTQEQAVDRNDTTPTANQPEKGTAQPTEKHEPKTAIDGDDGNEGTTNSRGLTGEDPDEGKKKGNDDRREVESIRDTVDVELSGNQRGDASDTSTADETGHTTTLETALLDSIQEGVGTGHALAEKIYEGQDITATLDVIATEFPTEAVKIALELQKELISSSTIDHTATDVLIWIKANLRTDPNNQDENFPVDRILDTRIVNLHEGSMLDAASIWIDPGQKTIVRIRESLGAMAKLETELTRDPAQIPLQDIMLANRFPGSNASANGYTLQPLTAYYANNENHPDDATKHTMMSNELYAQESGSPKFSFIADGLTGLLICHEGIPQQIITFDIVGATTTIRQMQGANRYALVGNRGALTKHIISKNLHMASRFDMSGIAIDVVAQTLAKLKLTGNPAEARLHVRSATNDPNIHKTRFPLARALKQYDATADRKGMKVDPASGNWSATLSNVVPN